MVDPWLTIIGIGEDGVTGLPDASRNALQQAEIIFGGPRHLELAGAGGKGRAWPVPFDIAPVLACRGRRVAVLASGDPFWFGVGGTLAAQLAPGEWRTLPAPGVLSLTAARLGWRLEDTTCLGLHAAGFQHLRPYVSRNCRIIATLRDGETPAALAAWLEKQGMGAMQMTMLERLGGPHERIRECRADGFTLTNIQPPVTVALNGAGLPRSSGLPQVPGRDDAGFTHDGQITKSPIRALTLAALAPRRGEVLWDIGGGSGSVSVEWGLAGGHACCVEARADRLDNIRANIDSYGLNRRVQAIHGTAPDALTGLPEPDAVFIGGGANAGMFQTLWPLLPPGARLVANAVTLETEALLIQIQAQYGGGLMRFDIAQAAPLGTKRGWQASRPVVQWSVTR